MSNALHELFYLTFTSLWGLNTVTIPLFIDKETTI